MGPLTGLADLLFNVAVLAILAWVVRALLGAHEVTWTRMLAAVAIGLSTGSAVAVLLLVEDIEQLTASPTLPDGFASVAAPFSVLATMVVIIVFELFSRRPPRPRELRRLRPIQAARRRLHILRRGLQVTRIATRHGLAPLLGLRRGGLSPRRPDELARRIRVALEEAGGMFVKLGQLLASRPDLLPPAALAELGRLHASASPLPRAEVEAAIMAETQAPLERTFLSVDWVPLGSASIAQVHTARLDDGREVVVKVRRPGLGDIVERDLAITRWLARTAERKTGWGRTLGVTELVEEFAGALRGELDFRREARYATEAADAAPRRGVRVPAVVAEHTTAGLLVMERLDGRPLSVVPRGQLPVDARSLADDLCASQVGAMLQGGRFHGDPHPGNVLLLADGRLGLVDFGITGRLDAFERSAMLQMLLAIKLSEPSLLYESLVAVGAVRPEREPEEIERALSRFMASSLGPGLPSVDALTELLRLTSGLGIRLPPQASGMFRALATLAGTLEHLAPGYPLIDQVAELGGVELRDRTSPSSLTELVTQEWIHLGPLLRRAPRHLDRIATLLEHGALSTRVRLFAEPADVRVIERLLNRAVLALLALGVVLASVLLLGVESGPQLAAAGVSLAQALGWFGLFSGTVLLLRVLLDILRRES